jgi:hypothetical protein
MTWPAEIIDPRQLEATEPVAIPPQPTGRYLDDMLDGGHADWSVSGDAMRWQPPA